jgi:hypothetical protein
MNGNGDSVDGRLLVLESDNKRHDECIKDHDIRIRSLEDYKYVINDIRTLLKNDVIPDLKNLNSCKISDESIRREKQAFIEGPYGKAIFQIIIYAFIALATYLYTVNQHIMVGK